MLALALSLAMVDADYARCPGHEFLAANATLGWRPVASMLYAHRGLRQALRTPLLTGVPRILWWAEGGHMSTTTFSVVATRRRDGIWRTSGVGQSRIWVGGAEATPLDPMERDLSGASSRALDAALADPCLASAPTTVGSRAGPPPLGALANTLEIEWKGKTWRGAVGSIPPPQVQTILNLIGR